MKQIRKQVNPRTAFTLIELLVVIAIIAMLIGIMAPGIHKATIVAKNLRQKSELKAMDTGLEFFAKDFDDYPESKQVGTGPVVTGAQHLAEALLGRDSHGIEPKTTWYAPNYKHGGLTQEPPVAFYDDSQDISLKRRKGPYVDLKYGTPHTIREMWGGNTGGSTIDVSLAAPVTSTQANLLSPVITDIYQRNSVTINGENVNVGMPILYFKADSTKPFRVDAARKYLGNPTPQQAEKWIFNYYDNVELIRLPVLSDPGLPDKDFVNPDNLSATADAQRAEYFYTKITQTAEKDRDYYKPFNNSTFILMSAGWDGVYGTKDDITNFNY